MTILEPHKAFKIRVSPTTVDITSTNQILQKINIRLLKVCILLSQLDKCIKPTIHLLAMFFQIWERIYFRHKKCKE